MPRFPNQAARPRRRLAVEPLEDRTTPSAGDLDVTFGAGGRVTTPVGPRDDLAFDLVIDRADRVVVAGTSWNGTDYDIAVARYRPDGTLDPTFGNGGVVRTDLGGTPDVVTAVTVDAAGRVVVAGRTGELHFEDVALVRYRPDGSLDPTFGTGGVVRTDFGSIQDSAQAVAIDPAGRIVVAGFTFTPTGYDVLVARYRPDGTLDPAFGAGGRVLTDFSPDPPGPGSGTADQGTNLVIDPSGRVVVTAIVGSGPDVSLGLARYLPDGRLDPGFGAGGKVVTDYAPGFLIGQGIALDPAGDLVVAGYVNPGPGPEEDFALLRYLPSGAPDPAFGSGGLTVVPMGPGRNDLNAVTVDAAGRPVAAGTVTTAGDQDFAVARFTPAGALDPTFGTGGVVTTPFAGPEDVAGGVALDRAGRIVVAGVSGTSGASSPQPFDFALARYLGDTVPRLVPNAVTSPGDVLYTENDPPTPIDPALLVADDGDELIGATVRVDHFNAAQDVIGFTLRPGIVGSFDPALGQLTLAGRASLADYQAVLRSVTYANTSDDPDTTPRTFTFTLDDGDPDAALGAGARTVQVRAVNDAPTLTGVPARLTAVPGHPIEFAFAAADVDGPGPLTFTLVGAPAGVSLDPDARTVTWTPGPDVEPGTYTFEVRAADGASPAGVARATVAVTVTRAAVLGNTLAVAGTSGPDVIDVRRTADGTLAVRVNGELVGTFSLNPGDEVEVHGFGGNDRVTVSAGPNIRSALFGESGDDVLTGGAGSDTFTGGAGNDLLVGGPGDDRYVFADGWGSDRVTDLDTAGADTFDFAPATAGVTVRIGGTISAISGRAAVTTRGAIFNVVGGSGPDTFTFAAGARLGGVLDGGPGRDLVSFAGYMTPVTVNLRHGTATGMGGVTGIEDAAGGAGSDILVGDGQDNRLTGNGGRDVLIGGGGADVLVGGAAGDLLIGGPTSHDLAPADLVAIRAEWVRPIAYATRVAHLLGTTPGGRNGAVLLDPASLSEDGQADVLTGGTGLDWFLTFNGDTTDATAGETVTHP
jgi:uncharacterized delta-60 repeat protein